MRSGEHFYVGYSSDISRRLEEHNAGQNQSTKKYKPWVVIFYEAYVCQADAIRRERYLKTTQGRQALKRMLREYFKSSGIYFDDKLLTT